MSPRKSRHLDLGQRLAAEAMVGLGPGIGAAAQPAAYEDDARQPSECIVYGLNNQELLMAVPKIIKMICVHMDVCRLAAEAELSGLGRLAVQAGSAGPAQPAGAAGSE